MQIKLIDGTVHLVAPAELLRIYNSMKPKSAILHPDALADVQWLTQLLYKV